MMHDKEIYPDPFDFKPERFLDENGQPDMSVPQPDTACFGFGQRYASNATAFLLLILFLPSYLPFSASVPEGIWLQISHLLP